MTIDELIIQIKSQPDAVEFDDVMDVIDEYFEYTPTHFTNGQGHDVVMNQPGSNEGSCKIFAFATTAGLSEQQTLCCFGKYYREDVLPHPKGNDHANIRTFMRHGWHGIHFEQSALIQHKES
ncbi:MAG: HopJ type III effector protein [Ectothiorhodospiraceae bacterium]|nr:HopJ type III effector protein [Ectothiorhodospiraceae bacterium]